MSIILWIVVGGIAGWLASIITKRNDQMGCLTNVVVGILGAVLGGWVASFFGFSASSFSLGGLLIAVMGAVILLLIIGWFQSRRA